MNDPARERQFAWQQGTHPLITGFTAEIRYSDGRTLTLDGHDLYMQVGTQRGERGPDPLIDPYEAPFPEPSRVVFDIRMARLDSKITVSARGLNEHRS
jgi:hypothetical protein